MANIFNNANPGYHIGIMCLIYRVLWRSTSPMTANQVEELCRPENLKRQPNHKKKFKQTLTFWSDESHCLWEENDDSMLVLLQKNFRTEPTPFEIAEVVRVALFKKIIPDIAVKTREAFHGTEPLFLLLSCLLASGRHLPFSGDPLETGKYSQITELISTYLDSSKHDLNSSEHGQVLPWFVFLGFVELNNNEIVVDPTRAVRDVIKHIFKSTDTLNIREFLIKLNKLLPIFDGGSYQKQTTEIMLAANNGWNFDYKNNISNALSVALYRLHVLKEIKLPPPKSDDPNAIQITHPFTKETKRISQIIYLGGHENA